MIKLIVGLGNPGVEYCFSRHNVGFWFIDILSNKLNIILKKNKFFIGFYKKIYLYDNYIHLLKPITYMNKSGKSIKKICNYFNFIPSQILVIHDDIYLNVGIVKLRFDGGNGGHNGLKNISDYISTNRYWRLRIGVGQSKFSNYYKNNRIDISDFVLSKPCEKDINLIKFSIKRSLSIMSMLIKGEFQYAMTMLN